MFSRTESLLGEKAMQILKQSHVAVFGLGGVGGHVAEALLRSGVGTLTVVDNDVVSVSNLNRQILALQSTIGQSKTQAFLARAKDINPDAKVYPRELFVLPETVGEVDFSPFDYVVDAIDTVSGKLAIIERAKRLQIPVISAMGAGNKLNATAFQVADISKTSGCPLARVMRRELKQRAIEGVKTVYSQEEKKRAEGEQVGSVAFVPAVMGLIIAGEVIKDLAKV